MIDLARSTVCQKNPRVMARKSPAPSDQALAAPLLWRRATLAARLVGVTLAAVALVAFFRPLGESLLVQQMAQRIHESDGQQAALLVGDLARLEAASYSSLASAASSNRSAVALAARREIDRRVDAWSQEVFLHPATFDLRSRAVPLAEALGPYVASMTASGQSWARGVLSRLLNLANAQPPEDRLALIAACDHALSQLSEEDATTMLNSAIDMAEALGPPIARVDVPATSPQADETTPPIPQSTYSSRHERSVNIPVTTAANRSQPPIEELVQRPWSPTWTKPQPSPAGSNPMGANAGAVDDATRDSQQAGSPISPPPPARPSLIAQIRDPHDRVPASEASLAPPPMSLDGDAADIPVGTAQSLSDREVELLFVKLASGSEEQQIQAAQELFIKGYGRPTPRDARMLASPSVADRLALVDLVLTAPRLEPRKWLWRLAHDPVGKVRAAALASIATSADAELIEAALQLAIRDSDPRVAEQTDLLRQGLR